MEVSVTYQGSVGTIADKWIQRLTPALAKEVLRLANEAGGFIAKIVVATFRGGGGLARSFLPARFVSSPDGVAAGALSDLPQAGVLDGMGRDSTTIYPKTVKNLSIPLTPQARTMWPRDWPSDELQLIPRQGRPTLLATVSGTKRGLKVTPQYVLVPSVTIRAHHYLDRAVDAINLQAKGESPFRLAEEMSQDEQGGGD